MRTDATQLAGFAGLLALVPFAFRMAGHFLNGLPFAISLAEPFVFVLVVLGAAYGNGLLLKSVSRRVDYPLTALEAQELAFCSAIPFFALGPLYAIPAPVVHGYVLLVSLGWGAVLLFRGLWENTGLDTRSVTVVALAGASAWILGAVVVSQLFGLLLLP
jgi:hypothetical protein